MNLLGLYKEDVVERGCERNCRGGFFCFFFFVGVGVCKVALFRDHGKKATSRKEEGSSY